MPIPTVHLRGVLLFTSVLLAPAVAMAASDAELLAELAEVAREAGVDLELPTWDVSASIDLAAGHRDNVTLAAINPDSSGFLRAHADVLAWRLPANGWEWLNFVDLTASRYFAVDERDSRQSSLIIARSEYTRVARPGLRLILGGQYIFQDEVIDASTLDSGLGTTLAQLHSYAVEPEVRLALNDRWEVRLKLSGKFDDFRPPLDDYVERDIELGIRRDLGSAGSLTLGVGHLVRDFSTRTQSTIGGRPIPGTKLEVDQDRIEARHEMRGGEHWKWRLKSRLAYQRTRDDGEGWYDYDRWYAALSGSLSRGPWLIEADLAWRRYDYSVQTAGFGEFEARKQRDAWVGSIRLERELSESLTFFAELELEDSNSNEALVVYQDRIAAIGLRWSL